MVYTSLPTISSSGVPPISTQKHLGQKFLFEIQGFVQQLTLVSVSRVGGNAQIKSMKKVAGTLK
jgi:hypothetical protein